MRPNFYSLYYSVSLLAIVLISSLSSCKVEESYIPSFVKVDSVSVNAESIGGNPVQQLTALQVYQGNQTIGTFPIPCKFPIDPRVKDKLSFVGYINNNGNTQSVIPLRSLSNYDTSVNWQEDSIYNINPVFNYRNNTDLLWQDDFESGNSTLIGYRYSSSDSLQVNTVDFDIDGRFMGKTKAFSLKIAESDTIKYLDIGYFEKFSSIPSDREVFFEFDLKSELVVSVALKRYYANGGEEYVPYFSVYPTGDKWKRLYSNFIYEIQGQPSGTLYEILFSVDVPADYTGNREILIDNIRLTYLK
ncbi:MAG: hypothetical protein ACON5K_07945 [Bacteroidia bacterium]